MIRRTAVPAAALLTAVLGLAACTSEYHRVAGAANGSGRAGATQVPDEPPPSTVGEGVPAAAPTAEVTVIEPDPPVEFDAQAAFGTVEHLAGEIGPREGTSTAFHEAADWVSDRFAQYGYDVTTVDVPVPAGDPSYRPEWGTVIEPGTSANVIADPPGFDAGAPHVVIGAHLDTVGVAPGAEDNASGVAIMLELARMVAAEPPAVPVRFIAFGAEEPRGAGDAMHHFGSQQYVGDLDSAGQDAVEAMVALDRVGVPSPDVPICTGGSGTTSVMDALLAAAAEAGIAAENCENRASDHWSFEKAGIPAARLGSVPYAQYHSAQDLPDVVSTDRLDQVGRIVWTWLTGFSG